jgi:hypothetical protein
LLNDDKNHNHIIINNNTTINSINIDVVENRTIPSTQVLATNKQMPPTVSTRSRHTIKAVERISACDTLTQRQHVDRVQRDDNDNDNNHDNDNYNNSCC